MIRSILIRILYPPINTTNIQATLAALFEVLHPGRPPTALQILFAINWKQKELENLERARICTLAVAYVWSLRVRESSPTSAHETHRFSVHSTPQEKPAADYESYWMPQPPCRTITAPGPMVRIGQKLMPTQ